MGMADEDQIDVLYHPVKTLGRGAFGEAVLYRRVEVWPNEMDGLPNPLSCGRHA